LELLFAVTLVAVVARRFHFPYATALVVAGLVLSTLHVVGEVELPPEFILGVFLPVLLFEAAINTEAIHLRNDVPIIATLSTVGFALMALVTGAIIHLVLGYGWPLALLAGTMFSITDTVAVLAVFKSLKVPVRLSTIVEGESLFNDGTALVLFKVLLGVVLTGTFHPGATLFEIVVASVGGFLVGGLLGLAVSWLVARTEDHLTEILLCSLLALGAYHVGERLHVSGVIAVVMAGLVVGNVGLKQGMQATSQIALLSFWEYAAFGVNSIVFLMVGLGIDLNHLAAYLPAILWSFLAFQLGRLVLIYGGLRLGRAELPGRWQHVMVWGNLKGSLTMVLALSLPATVAHREEILTIAFGVVLLSLVFQGLTLGPLVRWLDITGISAFQRAFEHEQVKLIRARAAQEEVGRLLDAGAISRSMFERMKARYQVSVAQAERALRRLGTDNQAHWDDAFAEMQQRLLVVEKAAITRAVRGGLISDEVGAESLAEIDTKLVAGAQRDPQATWNE
jgi:CPA1 family monovalent cation:H+ antiporter